MPWSQQYHAPYWSGETKSYCKMLAEQFKVTRPTAFILGSYSELMPLLSYMIRHDKAMYEDTKEWMTNIPKKKMDYMHTMTFKKKPSDYVKPENYGKYKQREVQKRIEEAKKKGESDLKNINRWLDDEKKAAKWR